MKIKVIGKAHLQGHSKRTDKDYNFIQVHFVGPSRGVEGMAGQTINLDPAQFPLSSIIVGETYNVEYGPRNTIMAFEPVKA